MASGRKMVAPAKKTAAKKPAKKPAKRKRAARKGSEHYEIDPETGQLHVVGALFWEYRARQEKDDRLLAVCNAVEADFKAKVRADPALQSILAREKVATKDYEEAHADLIEVSRRIASALSLSIDAPISIDDVTGRVTVLSTDPAAEPVPVTSIPPPGAAPPKGE